MAPNKHIYSAKHAFKFHLLNTTIKKQILSEAIHQLLWRVAFFDYFFFSPYEARVYNVNTFVNNLNTTPVPLCGAGFRVLRAKQNDLIFYGVNTFSKQQKKSSPNREAQT